VASRLSRGQVQLSEFAPESAAQAPDGLAIDPRERLGIVQLGSTLLHGALLVLDKRLKV
jgi:hypothetical protein